VEELEKILNSKRVAKDFVKAPEEEACGGLFVHWEGDGVCECCESIGNRRWVKGVVRVLGPGVASGAEVRLAGCLVAVAGGVDISLVVKKCWKGIVSRSRLACLTFSKISASTEDGTLHVRFLIFLEPYL
jgi:hypothetical protein